jgi:N-acetylglutamate synthase-like GNAT family acetyltransferase
MDARSDIEGGSLSLLKMIIREANALDLKAIKRLLVQLGYPDLSESEVMEKMSVHTKPSYYLMVVEMEGAVIAFAALHWFEMLHRKGTLGRITAFCVDENFRSKGIGQQLLKVAEEHLRKQGCARLEVTSNVRRDRAHQFYLKSGYLEDSLRFVKN